MSEHWFFSVEGCWNIFHFFQLVLFQQVPAQNWRHPSMGGNLASHTAWAMKFIFSVSLVMNLWDQRAGFVRKAWPGAASRLPAEVCTNHLFSGFTVSPLTHPSSQQCLSSSSLWVTNQWHCYLTRWSPYNPVITLFVTFPSPALTPFRTFCMTLFFNVAIHFIYDPW